MANAFLIRLAIFVLVVATLCSLPLRPLWVDEIYQLEATRDLPVTQLLHSSMLAPGGMPLGYLSQTIWLKLVGFSRAQARVPAALFGLGSVWATAWIARQLSFSAPFATLLALLTPILFRYSTEARPYSQGLFFSTLSTALFLFWLAGPSKPKWLTYLLCNVAGIYSQPFSFFIPLAHGIYVLFLNRRRLLPICTAIMLTGVAYAPWFVISQKALQRESWLSQMFFSWRQVPPLVLIREISGGGYVCSVSLLLLAAIGITTVKKDVRVLLLCCVTVPAVLAIAADAKFDYFFAIRQLIFAVPPLLLLATAGVHRLSRQRKSAAALLCAIYITGAVVKNVSWQRDHKEDWATAAATIKNRLQATHGCVFFHPPRDAHAYYFFEPSLRSQTCENTVGSLRAFIAVSPYASAVERRSMSKAENVGGTLIASPTS